MGIIEIFSRPVFWIFMGLLLALIIYSAKLWAKDLGLKMNWWKWLLAGLWFIILSLSIAGGFTLIGEREVTPGLYFLGSFLVINFLLGALIWRVIAKNREKG
jgi:hypothetical protein